MEIHVQHGRLRTMLKEVSLRGTAAQQGDEAAAGGLQGAARSLRRHLHEHMAFEESTLVPVLKSNGPSGTARADKLIEEHVRQRAELATLIEVLDQQDNLPGIVLALQALIRDVLTDMDYEERDLLRSDVFRRPGML